MAAIKLLFLDKMLTNPLWRKQDGSFLLPGVPEAKVYMPTPFLPALCTEK